MGAWIEINLCCKLLLPALSHPTWVRGLKFLLSITILSTNWSHPTWVRGLKSFNGLENGGQETVAPHMGAWIEIKDLRIRKLTPKGRTPHGCVD